MKTDLKHLLDLPSEGFLTATFSEAKDKNGPVMSIMTDTYLYTVMVEIDVDKLFNLKGINYVTDLNAIKASRFKIVEVIINEDMDNTMDLKLVYNNKTFWIKVHACLRRRLC